MRILLFLGFLVLSMLVPVGLAQAQPPSAPDLQRAEALIRAGKADEAWRLLSPHEFSLAGREDFDYLLGVAALESGRADRATLIFERVLAVSPNHAAARLDMARAYFAIGDFDRARQEFQAVRQLSPPQAALVTIDRYIAAIDERVLARGRRTAGYVEAVIGTDGNVNVSPGDTVAIPAFGSVSLAAGSRTLRDDYRGVNAGVEHIEPIGDGLSLLLGGDLRYRDYFTNQTFDYYTADARAGVEMARGNDTVRVFGGHGVYMLESERYRRTNSLTGEWRRGMDARNQLTAFGQYNNLRYHPWSARGNNVNQYLGGVGWLHLADLRQPTLVFGSLLGGYEDEINGRADGNRTILGFRLGGQRNVAAQTDLVASLGLQHSRYLRANFLFDENRRRDWQFDASVGVNWRFAPHWVLKPLVAFTRNDSNQSINDYKRYDVSLTVRRDFQ